MKKLSQKLLVVFVFSFLFGCSNHEAEENKRKAQMFDAEQASKAQAQAAEQENRGNLKTCFNEASSRAMDERESGWAREGCNVRDVNTLPYEKVAICNQIAEWSHQSQKADEDRCVKLYK